MLVHKPLQLSRESGWIMALLPAGTGTPHHCVWTRADASLNSGPSLQLETEQLHLMTSKDVDENPHCCRNS
jgi:hypothetical protein